MLTVACSMCCAVVHLDFDIETAKLSLSLHFYLLKILGFMGTSHPGSSLSSTRDLFCFLQQVTFLWLVFLICEMWKINPLQNSLGTNSTKGHEVMKRQRLFITLSTYTASETFPLFIIFSFMCASHKIQLKCFRVRDYHVSSP